MVSSAGRLVLNQVTIAGGLANPDGTGFGGGGLLTLGVTRLVASSVRANVSLTDGGGISNVLGTLQVLNSTIIGNSAVNAGGGLRNGGGTVAMVRSIVRANQSTGTGSTARGGGLANHATPVNATMTVAGGLIAQNASNGIGGAGLDNAAAEANTAILTVTGVRIASNVANGVDHTTGLGGGIQNSFFRGVRSGTARVTVDRSVITNNTAVNGGGLSNGFDLSGTYVLELAVMASEVSENTASGAGFQVGNGGGIYSVNGSETIANTTVSGNAATGTGSAISGLGGGLMNSGLSGVTGTLSIAGSTIASNHAANAGGGIGAIPFDGGAVTDVTHSAVAYNTGATGSGCAAIGTTITSNGHNVEDTDTCALDQPTDLVTTDPLLGDLLPNGGPTRTRALLPGSPAIDAGDDAVCAVPPIAGLDQRGVSRPQGAACDIGAYEAGVPP